MSLLEVFQKIYLQRWLTRQDLTGMANSVEVRVPFLGLELARVVNRISLDKKMGKGQSKWIIKALMSDQFSAEFLNRKKVGFDFPLNDWIGDEHIDYLRQRPDLIEGNALSRILADNVGSFMRNRIVFSLVALALWSDSLSLGRRH
jgi:asparagine synthase (glutamine-hydrolysing)